MTVRPSWFANAILLAVACCLAVALSEAAVRVFLPQPKGLSLEDPYGLTMHWPGLVRRQRVYGVEIATNSAGMRDREHAIEKQSGVFRVLLLGDSFMEAYQVPFAESLPHLLEGLLAEQTNRRVEVINASVSGWGTDDELRYLTAYGLRYRPDLVLVAMCLHNDVSDNLREEWHTLRNDTLVEVPHPRKGFFSYKLVQVKAALANRFDLYQLLRKVRHGGEIQQTTNDLQSHVSKLFVDPPPADIARGLRLTALELERLRLLAAADSARTALLLLPINMQLSDSGFARFAASAGPQSSRMQIYRPQRTMMRIADSLGIPVIDLLPAFRESSANGGELFLSADGHWKANGHLLAAQVLSKALVGAQVVPSVRRHAGPSN
jgi:hypothetical protein